MYLKPLRSRGQWSFKHSLAKFRLGAFQEPSSPHMPESPQSPQREIFVGEVYWAFHWGSPYFFWRKDNKTKVVLSAFFSSSRGGKKRKKLNTNPWKNISRIKTNIISYFFPLNSFFFLFFEALNSNSWNICIIHSQDNYCINNSLLFNV